MTKKPEKDEKKEEVQLPKCEKCNKITLKCKCESQDLVK